MFDSLKRGGEVSDEILDYYSREGGDGLLYELRFLSVEQRVDPAVYIAVNDLDQRVIAPAKPLRLARSCFHRSVPAYNYLPPPEVPAAPGCSKHTARLWNLQASRR